MSRNLACLVLSLTFASVSISARGLEPIVDVNARTWERGSGTSVEPASWTLDLAGSEDAAAGAFPARHAHCTPIYAQADLLYWDRVGNGCDRVLAVDTSIGVPGEDAVLNSGDLAFQYEPGVRLLVGFRPDPCHGCGWCCAWELSYFGIYSWEAGAAAAGDNNLAIPGTLGLNSNNFFGAEEIRADYDSELHNVELNCVKSCCLDACTRIDFLSGFRVLALCEDFSLTGTDLQEGSSSYDVSTANYLYGLQLGGRLRRYCWGWGVELTGKAAVFVNDAQQRQIVRDYPDNLPIRELTGSDGQQAAMLGEVGLTLIRPITDFWSVRIGYQALGIGGLALASDQLDFNDTFTSGTALHKDGWMFLHGAHVGLEAQW